MRLVFIGDGYDESDIDTGTGQSSIVLNDTTNEK